MQKDFLEKLQIPAVIIDAQMQIQSANKMAALFFDRENWAGFGVQDLGVDSAALKNRLKPIQDGLVSFHATLNIASRATYARIDVHKQEGSEGLLLTFTDDSALVQSEDQLYEAIKESNDHKFALDQSAIVAITDSKGVITYVNEMFENISQFSKSELIGKTHKLINSGYHSGVFFRDMWQTIASGEVWKGEVKNIAKDGSYYWVDTTIVPFLDANGAPYKYLAIRFDITEKKQTLETVESERNRALYSEKMASLGQMAAGIAHELGNPVSSLKSWFEVATKSLESGDMELDELVPLMKSVTGRVDHMTKIIRSMLSYARDGSKDPFEQVDLYQLVDGVLAYSSNLLKKSKTEVRFSEEPQSALVMAKPSEIAQVLTNLISNACDAVRGLEERWIEIEFGLPDDKLVEIVIQDSGQGIPDEIQGRILEPFFTTKPAGGGTGLGLSISRQIMQDHGGTLEYRLLRGHTAFVLTLPRSQ